MRPAVRIVTWYALLVTPAIAVLYSDGSWLSGTMAVIASTAISAAAIRNVSGLARRNGELTGRIGELERVKKDFVSHVSHELKAPLASMQETTHLMLERIPGPLTEKQERLLQLNLQSGKRLAVMIGNLLDLSRLEAGIVDYEMQLQDIVEIAQGVVVEMNEAARLKSLRLVTGIPREPLMVMCDPNRMVQIFSNLLDNAIRFSAKGGIVSMHAGYVKHFPVRAPRSVRGPNGYVLVAISDSGPGIEDLHKQGVFETFHQAKQGKKTHGQSLGLGLAISRALVEAHNGAIWVEDNPNGGCVFFVLFARAVREENELPRAS